MFPVEILFAALFHFLALTACLNNHICLKLCQTSLIDLAHTKIQPKYFTEPQTVEVNKTEYVTSMALVNGAASKHSVLIC